MVGRQFSRLALLDQIRGQLALGEQGIGGDVLAGNLDGVEQGDGHFDFVRAFDLFSPLYG